MVWTCEKISMLEKMQVTGNRLPGRTKRTWEQFVQKDMKKKELKEDQRSTIANQEKD